MTVKNVELLVIRARLFTVSYAALWLMFAFRFGGAKSWWPAVTFCLVTMWAFIDGWRIVRSTARESTSIASVNRLDDQSGAVSTYLATYLLPFLGNMPQNWGDWLAFALYFVVALIVYVKSDLALMNPTLYLLGKRVLRGRIGTRDSLILSSEGLEPGDHVRFSELAGMVVVHEIVRVAEDDYE